MLLCCLAGSASAGDAAALLERIADTYGASGQPTTIRQTGTTESARRGRGSMERLWQGPDRFRIRLSYGGGVEERVLDGHKAWRSGRPMGEIFRQAMLLQAARATLPWSLLGSRKRVRHVGSTDSNGRPAELLILPLEGSLGLAVEVDAKTARILRTTGAGIEGIQFVTEYADFVTEDGLFLRALSATMQWAATSAIRSSRALQPSTDPTSRMRAGKHLNAAP